MFPNVDQTSFNLNSNRTKAANKRGVPGSRITSTTGHISVLERASGEELDAIF